MMRPSVGLSIIGFTIFVTACSSGGAATPAASAASPAGASAVASGSSAAAAPGQGFAGAALADVATFTGGFVTVGSAPSVDGGQSGGIWTSADGVTWTAAPPTTLDASTIQAATPYGDGILAVGKTCSGECGGFYSWRTTAPGTWAGPARASADFATIPVAVAARDKLVIGAGFENAPGGDGHVMSSPDGETWTQVPDVASMQDARMAAIAAGKGFVVVGNVTTSAGRTAAAWTSPDGATWTRAADDPSFANATFSSVVTGGPGYVAVGSIGNDGAVWTSADGKKWTRIADQGAFAGDPILDLATNGTGFIAIANGKAGGMAWTSADGMAWTPVPTIAGSADAKFVSVALGPKSSVIVGKPAPPTPAAGLIFQGPLP
jgi:hypothetical protein